MESNKVEKIANERPKFRKGRKKSETSTSQTKRPKEKKELGSYSDVPSPDEDDGTVTVESKGRVSSPHQMLDRGPNRCISP
ncbi:hypothetical protein A2U01_0031208 [Trifolium medium]|uniref:Uncharacterized protein n=1 Tax=Trifolium medium TaxID=97028 RepID=A0A392PFN3_9FABA|nr:hypothetical protein [Trifolium medium]